MSLEQLSVLLGIIALLPSAILVYRWWGRRNYTKFITEFLAAYHESVTVKNFRAKEAQHQVRRIVETLSRRYFYRYRMNFPMPTDPAEEPQNRVKPPPPRDPTVQAVFDQMIPPTFKPHCHLCGLDDKPDDTGCCSRCGLFCLIWAIGPVTTQIESD